MKIKQVKLKFLVMAMVIFLLYMPINIDMQKQMDKTAVIIALGIDKINEDLQVSAQVVVPNFELRFNKNLVTVSALSNNLSGALNNISANMGKTIGLAHLQTIVISDSVGSDNIVEILNALKNEKEVANAILINTTNSAKELLEVSGGEENYVSLNDIIRLNNKKNINSNSNLINFFSGYTKFDSVNNLIIININEQEEDLNTEQEQNLKTLVNNQEIAIYKNGIKQLNLEKEIYDNFNLLTPKSIRLISINNYSDKFYNNAQITLRLTSQNIFQTFKFKNNIPRVYVNLIIDAEIKDVVEEEFDLIKELKLTKELKDKIELLLKGNLSEAINFAKQESLDLFGIYSKLYAFKNNEFKDYLNSLANKTDFLERIEYFVNISIN